MPAQFDVCAQIADVGHSSDTFNKLQPLRRPECPSTSISIMPIFVVAAECVVFVSILFFFFGKKEVIV